MNDLNKIFEGLTYVKCEWLVKMNGFSTAKVGDIQLIDEANAKRMEQEGLLKIIGDDPK